MSNKKILELTYGEVEIFEKYMSKQGNALETNPLSGSFWIKFNRNKRKIDELYNDFVNAANSVGKFYSDDEHSTEVEKDGEKYRVVKDEYIADFSKKMQSLRLEKVEIEIDTIPEDEIADIKMNREDAEILTLFVD